MGDGGWGMVSALAPIPRPPSPTPSPIDQVRLDLSAQT